MKRLIGRTVQQVRISGRPLGAVLRDLRVVRRLSVEDFAKMMHYAPNTLRNYESGYGRMTRERFLEAVQILAPERMTELMAFFDIGSPERAEGFNGTRCAHFQKKNGEQSKVIDKKYSPKTMTSIRERRKFSKNQFALALGLSLSMISLIESGKRRWSATTAENIAAWAEKIGAPLSNKEHDDLFGLPDAFKRRKKWCLPHADQSKNKN